jgi:hypothetical protein
LFATLLDELLMLDTLLAVLDWVTLSNSSSFVDDAEDVDSILFTKLTAVLVFVVLVAFVSLLGVVVSGGGGGVMDSINWLVDDSFIGFGWLLGVGDGFGVMAFGAVVIVVLAGFEEVEVVVVVAVWLLFDVDVVLVFDVVRLLLVLLHKSNSMSDMRSDSYWLI